MPEVTCKHRERIEEFHRYALGTCTKCGQVRRYDRLDLKQPPQIIKMGRLNGHPVSVHPPKEVNKMMVGVNTEVDSCIQQETVPPRPRRGKLGRKFYEDNKEAILRDYQDLTLKEFYAKRAIWAGTWTALKRAWGIQGKYPKNAHRKPIADKATDEPKVTKVSKVTKVNKGNLVSLGTFTVEAASELPAFPAFNDNWPMLTQIEWLQTYRVLRERG